MTRPSRAVRALNVVAVEVRAFAETLRDARNWRRVAVAENVGALVALFAVAEFYANELRDAVFFHRDAVKCIPGSTNLGSRERACGTESGLPRIEHESDNQTAWKSDFCAAPTILAFGQRMKQYRAINGNIYSRN